MKPHTDSEWEKLRMLKSFGYWGNRGYPVRRQLLRVNYGSFWNRIVLEDWRGYNRVEPTFEIK